MEGKRGTTDRKADCQLHRTLLGHNERKEAIATVIETGPEVGGSVHTRPERQAPQTKVNWICTGCTRRNGEYVRGRITEALQSSSCYARQ